VIDEKDAHGETRDISASPKKKANTENGRG